MGYHFSKSKYCQLWQCPKLLWLDRYHPELKTPDPALEERLAVGNQLGELAKSYFGEYEDMTVLKNDGSPDLAAMLNKTRDAIATGVETICEAAFSYDGLYCAVDILRKENGGYAIYEVKSSTHDKEIYGVDIAYQKYVLEHCGVKVTGTNLVCINSDYVRGEDLDVQGLLKVIDMIDEVGKETPNIPNRLAAGQSMMESTVEPTCSLGCHCAEPYECGYWAYCSRNLPSPSVMDLCATRLPGLKLMEQGAVTFTDALTRCKLNNKQKRQIRHILSGCGDEVDKEGIAGFLDTLSYPLYFLDFESMQQTIPQYPQTKPYAQIVFQYSLHYIESPGGEMKHKEFLAESGPDPRRAVAESLCHDIPMHSCVMVFNKTFESGRLKELAVLFPDLAPHLLSIRSNIRDLLDPFRSGFYYNSRMGGSFSIKSVLPALFPDDPELDYHNLEGIHNGSEAMNVFPKLKDMPPEEAAAVRRSLLCYCKLDTYAMVKVWEKLCEVVK